MPTRSPSVPFPVTLVVLGSACFVLSIFGCSAVRSDHTDEGENALTTYGELFTTLEGPDLDRWYAARATLLAGFDRICGDTICSGDYSNLATVDLTCSSTASQRKLKDCTWILGGSIDHVDHVTGEIWSHPRVFVCKIPIAGTASELLSTLEAAKDDALHAALPSTGKSFYDGLVGCFEGVTGGPPPDVVAAPAFRDVAEWLWDTGRGAQWSETTHALTHDFDQICGDTFCEGEYSDIEALRFVCSMNVETARLSRCQWTFAAADSSVGSRGAIASNVTTFRCDVPIDAPAEALVEALATPDPLEARLPGRDTTLYDALVECL